MAQGKNGVWSGLPMWAKGTIAVVSVLAVGTIGYLIYRGIKKAVDKSRGAKEGKEAEDKLSDLANKNIKPTISEAEAQAKVSTLLAAANDCDPTGSGATQIIAVMKSLKNEADYYMLNSTFGNKTWAACGWGDTSGSLTTLLIEELDSGQMVTIRKHLSSLNVNI